MGNAAPLAAAEGAVPDLKTAVDLARVGRNDLAVEFFGKAHGEGGFAGRGRADDDDEAHVFNRG